MTSQLDPESRSPGTREKILDVAESLIAVHGTEGFQLKDVAATVGIRPPSIYAHFEGRDAIAQEVAYRLYRRIQIELEMDQLGEGDPRDALQRMVGRMVRYFARSPGHLRLMLRDLSKSAFPRSKETPSHQVWLEITESFQALIRRGIASGAFRDVRLESAQAQIIGGILVNLAWFGWDDEGKPVLRTSLEEIESESKELVLRLLCSSRA